MSVIKVLSNNFDPRWNAYVKAHADATCFHQSEWANVSAAMYGWRPHYLVAEDEQSIRGVLPLVEVTQRFGRGALVSSPFCVYGGAVADNEEVVVALENFASALARERNVAFLEVRQSTRRNLTWQSSELFYTFKKTLAADNDANLAAVPRKQRAMIRKGEKAGLKARFDDNSLDTFYALYARSMHLLGTPASPRRLFEIILDTFAGQADILIVEHDGEPVAAVLSLYFRDEVLPYYAGSLPRARSLAAFDYMYWCLLERAVQRGYRQFDFGRSMRGTGAFAFKKNWGFTARALNYQYDVIHGTGLPVKDPNLVLYKTLANIWRKLPLPVANLIAPLAARSLY